MLAMKVVAKRFRNAFAFIITCTRADTAYGTDIVFRLRVHIGVAIDFAGRGLKQAGAGFLAIFESVERPEEIGSQGSDAVATILAGRARTCKMIDPIDDHVGQSVTDVTLDIVEFGIGRRLGEIALRSRFQIVVAPYIVPKLQQPVAKMRADESGSPRDQYFQVRPQASVLRYGWSDALNSYAAPYRIFINKLLSLPQFYGLQRVP